MEQIASGMSGVYGLFARALVGYLVARGKTGGEEGLGHVFSLTVSMSGL